MSNSDNSKPTSNVNPHVPFWMKFITGGIAGIIGTSLMFPVDTVKTNLQLEKFIGKGPINVISELFKSGGIRAFYRGIRPVLVGVTPEKAIKLAVNDNFRDYFIDKYGYLSLQNELIAATAAGFCQVTFSAPIELVKVQFQSGKTIKANVNDLRSFHQVVETYGFRKGLYRGYCATLLRDVPYCWIFFPLYGHLKTSFADVKTGETAWYYIMLAGGIAGGVAAGAMTPADVIKTRIQSNFTSTTRVLPNFRTIIENEGYSRLFKGFFPRVFVQFPLYAIIIFAFEVQKRLLIMYRY